MGKKQAKVLIKRKKFFEVDIPIVKMKAEIAGETLSDIEGKTILLDLTRQLKGKSVEATFKVIKEKEKVIAVPKKIKLMPYFIRRMIRKRTSYVEDSFQAKTKESLVQIKPFLITRKKVSRAIRKTLRNLAKNWIEDYLKGKTDEEVFSELLSNRFQKPLYVKLKKTYPLSLCEIRVIEVIRTLKLEEIPKNSLKEEEIKSLEEEAEKIEKKKIEKAEKEIKETQKVAEEIEETESKEEAKEEIQDSNKEPAKKEEKSIEPKAKKKVSKKKTKEDKKEKE